MNADLTLENLCAIVDAGIRTSANVEKLSEPITADSKMGSPKEWDSLSFVAVFTGVGEAFDAELEYDDAIHFRDIRSIHALLQEILD